MGPSSSKIDSPSLFGSDFDGIDYINSSNAASNLEFPSECDVDTMEVIIHLYSINSFSRSKWEKFSRRLKNRVIHDFLNTLYCTSHAFDEIFLLLFTNAKSRNLLSGSRDRITTSALRSVVEDILMYSSSAGLKYHTQTKARQRCLERMVDYPLKTFSLCPCTRRPLYVAMYLSRPDVVHLLLKNGARIPYEDVCDCMEEARHPLRNVMGVLKVSHEATNDAEDDFTKSARSKKNILSLKLILVDVNHSSAIWTNILDTLEHLTETERQDNIPSLKHIVRANIRNIMRDNPCFCDPHVWEKLYLPKTLISYMNLEEYSLVDV